MKYTLEYLQTQAEGLKCEVWAYLDDKCIEGIGVRKAMNDLLDELDFIDESVDSQSV